MAGIIDLIGNTPMVELSRLNPNPNVRIFAKLEGNNPGGSVKDRASLNMIRSAIERGQIKTGTKLVEATSGNTGIALAMIAGLYGLEIELVMPSNSTRERTLTMEAFGAKVTLLDSIEKCRDYADEKGASEGYFLLNQFANSDNYMSHYKTTGPEIWRDTEGKITHFVSAMGTTGTIMGCSRYFKEKNSDIQIVGCQPTEESSIPGIRRWPTEYLPKIFEPSRVDRTLDISQEEATQMSRRLVKEEGVFAGMSSGGACAAALKVASEITEGTIVFIACDRGDRYLSSPLFDNMEHRIAIIGNYLEGYNRFDIEQMLADCDEQVVFENVSGGEVNMSLVGLSAFRNQAEQAKAYFSFRNQKVTSYKHESDCTEVQIEYYAVAAMDFPNGLQKGDELRLEGKSIFKFEGGKIVRITDLS